MPRIIGPVCGPVPTLTGYDNADFRNLLVDLQGRLQVDVVDSGLPALAATAANQVTMITALQLIDDLYRALSSVGTDQLRIRAVVGGIEVDAASTPGQLAVQASVDALADIPYQGEHYHREQANVVCAFNAWTEIITADVPGGSVWYVAGWGGHCTEDNTRSRLRLQVAGSDRHSIRAAGNSQDVTGICFGKATAGQSVSVDGRPEGEVDKQIHAWYIVIEV